jgi:hypothetical protein
MVVIHYTMVFWGKGESNKNFSLHSNPLFLMRMQIFFGAILCIFNSKQSWLGIESKTIIEEAQLKEILMKKTLEFEKANVLSK